VLNTSSRWHDGIILISVVSMGLPYIQFNSFNTTVSSTFQIINIGIE